MKDQQALGFAYLALLTTIAASLVALMVALPDLYQTAKREREAQLLFVGQQYQQAIQHFYENPNVTIKRYPKSIDELLVDNRSLRPLHHLRKAYADPMTRDGQWEFIKNEQQQIMGVYSHSTDTLLKTHIQSDRVTIALSGGPITYADLKFVYLPGRK